jgi:hypothetical protein
VIYGSELRLTMKLACQYSTWCAQEAQKKLSSFAIGKSTSRGTPTNALPKVIKTRTMSLLRHLFLAIISRIQATFSSVLKS